MSSLIPIEELKQIDLNYGFSHADSYKDGKAVVIIRKLLKEVLAHRGIKLEDLNNSHIRLEASNE